MIDIDRTGICNRYLICICSMVSVCTFFFVCFFLTFKNIFLQCSDVLKDKWRKWWNAFFGTPKNIDALLKRTKHLFILKYVFLLINTSNSYLHLIHQWHKSCEKILWYYHSSFQVKYNVLNCCCFGKSESDKDIIISIFLTVPNNNKFKN